MRPSLLPAYHFNLYTVDIFGSFELGCLVVAILLSLQLFAIENIIQIDVDNADLKKTENYLYIYCLQMLCAI